MTEETRIRELVDAGVDGELSPEEERELNAMRQDRADVEAWYLEASALANSISTMAVVEPPEGLKDRILDSLPSRVEAEQAASQPRQTTARSGSAFDALIDSVRGLLSPAPAFRLAVAFLAGVAVTSLFTIGPLSQFDVGQDAVGTIGAAPGQVTDVAPVTTPIDGQGFVGAVALRRTDGTVSLALEGRASRPVSIEIVVLSVIHAQDQFEQIRIVADGDVAREFTFDVPQDAGAEEARFRVTLAPRTSQAQAVEVAI